MLQQMKTGLLFAHLETDEDSHLDLIAVQRLTIIFSIEKHLMLRYHCEYVPIIRYIICLAEIIAQSLPRSYACN